MGAFCCAKNSPRWGQRDRVDQFKVAKLDRGHRADETLNLISDPYLLDWLGRTLCSLSHLHLKSGYELDPRVGQELLAENDAMVCVFF